MKHFIKDMGMRKHTILCLLLTICIILFSCADSSPGNSGGSSGPGPLVTVKTVAVRAGTDTAKNLFGRSTAISQDGNTMAIGAPFTTKETSASSSTLEEGFFAGHREAGSVYIFSKANAVWTQQAHLEGAGFAAQFGTSASLSSNGSVLAVGAPGEAKVYIYTRTGTQWTQAKVIGGLHVNPGGKNKAECDAAEIAAKVAANAAGDKYTIKDCYESDAGRSVALNADGTHLVIGSPNVDSVHIYHKDGTAWTKQGPTLKKDNYFGYAVAISSDGNTIAIGAPYNHTTKQQGAVYVYRYESNAWTEQKKLVGDSTHIMFGVDVVLSGDGNTLATTALSSDGLEDVPSLFRYENKEWNAQSLSQ